MARLTDQITKPPQAVYIEGSIYIYIYTKPSKSLREQESK
jgi:hypothetical protein